MLAAIFREMRVQQYTKNAFVLAAPLFSGKIFQSEVCWTSVLAFFAFSFIASVVYIGNDIMDRDKDRQHPTKCHRPIAAGIIAVPSAVLMMTLLFISSLLLAYVVQLSLVWLIIVYLLMNVAYSLWLKHVVIIDVMIIALGFVLRALAGVVVAGSGATTWFILCVFMLSLFLALAKRRGELVALARQSELTTGDTRRVLSDYSVELLNMLIVVVCAVMLTSYALFSSCAQGMAVYGLPLMMLTLPFVVYGVFRYLYLLIMCEVGEQPEEILLHDKGILLTVILYICCIIMIRDI